jgi:acetyl esterase/lipase
VLAYPLLHKELPAMTAELQAKYDALPQQERFSPETVGQINANYVDDPAALDDQTAFPGGHDLTGFPPTLIVNSDADSLRASGQRFAAELAAAGVDTTVVLEPGTRHGHLDQPDSPGAVRTMQRMTHWLDSTFPD